jgi:hypothetical protein
VGLYFIGETKVKLHPLKNVKVVKEKHLVANVSGFFNAGTVNLYQCSASHLIQKIVQYLIQTQTNVLTEIPNLK